MSEKNPNNSQANLDLGAVAAAAHQGELSPQMTAELAQAGVTISTQEGGGDFAESARAAGIPVTTLTYEGSPPSNEKIKKRTALALGMTALGTTMIGAGAAIHDVWPSGGAVLMAGGAATVASGGAVGINARRG